MTFGKTDGVLKPLDEVLLPDPRFKFFALESTAGVRPFELADMHSRLSISKLDANVPEKVRRQFETARNLMLYSWFVFEFHTVAELQAYAALELALGERFGFPKRKVKTRKGVKLVPLMLAELLQKAVSEKVVVADKLPAWEQVQARRAWDEKNSPVPLGPPMSSRKWLEAVIKGVPNFRNALAHGEPKLYLFAAFWQLELCANLINALYPEASKS